MTAEKTVTKAVRTRSDQDRRMADRISKSRTLLHRIQGDAVLAAKLATRGFDGGRLQEGIALTNALQTKFAQRQQAFGMQNTEVAAMQDGYELAHKAFFELRASARIAYPDDPGMRRALGTVGEIPRDGDKFQTVVRAALAVAAESPHKDDLATVGFTGAKHTALTQSLETLELRRQVVAAAKERAQQATRERDTASAELSAYLAPLEQALKLIERLG